MSAPSASVAPGPVIAGPAPETRGLPRVRLREPTVGPSYPPELITAVVRRSKPGIRKCVGELPSLSPLGTLTFTIESDGRVTDAAFKNDDAVVAPGRSQQCVLDAIRAMEFAPPRGRIIVSYPLASDPAW